MCKLITEIISKIFGGLNIKATNRSSHNSIKGDANNSPQAGRDLINLSNNAFFFSFPDMLSNQEKIRENFKKFADGYLNSLSQKTETKSLNLNGIFSRLDNIEAFYNVVYQLFVSSKESIERHSLLNQLLLEKFQSKEDEVDIYLRAIEIVKDLTVRDLKVLSIIVFITLLSSILQRETVKANSSVIINMLKEVGNVDIEEIRHMENIGVLCSLFPYMYDDMDFVKIQQIAPQLYIECRSFLDNHIFISGFKITSLGRIVVKAFISTCYGLTYEDMTDIETPVKLTDLHVGNVTAVGNITAHGEVSSGN